jgi:triacylglycerol lipase
VAYDYSRRALYAPGTVAPFAGGAPAAQFDPAQTGFSKANAWWLANFSHVAYHAPAVIPSLLPAGVSVRSFDRGGTQAYIADAGTYAVLAFRGMEIGQLDDLLTCANAAFCDGPVGRVHHGFADALRTVWDEIQPTLDELDGRSVPVWYTGHSMGGALATLAAAHRAPASLQTFAAPCVGDSSFASALVGYPCFRFVNCCDYVPDAALPRWGYRHGGELDFMSSDGIVTRGPDDAFVAAARRRGRRAYLRSLAWLRICTNVTLRRNADHSITNYAHGLL